jgi:hypothetical protein
MVNKNVRLTGTADVQSKQMVYINTCVSLFCMCVCVCVCFLLDFLACLPFILFASFSFFVPFYFLTVFVAYLYHAFPLFFVLSSFCFLLCIRTYVFHVQLFSVYTFSSDIFYQ